MRLLDTIDNQIDKKNLNDFIINMNKNAPLSNKYKYPYKPTLLIALLTSVKLDDLFNKPISLKNKHLIKKYYDILTSDISLFNLLKNNKWMKDWLDIGFNEYIEKKLLANIIENPATKLIKKDNNFYSFNKTNKTITFNIIDDSKKEEIKKALLDSAFSCLKKCVPSYENFGDNEILNYENYMEQVITSSLSDEKISNSNNRIYQHIFAKLVKDRDKRCVICCENIPQILQAAHIKPFAVCENQEKYDSENGITLCANHHLMFDRKMFTFNLDWTIKILVEETEDYNLKLKEFEPCFSRLGKERLTNNEFLGYRNNNL